MTPSKIAQWTYKERHNITTLVNRMSREGLVVAKRSRKDRRSVNITLTDKGREVLNQARPVAREIVNQMMSSISEGDALQIEKLLVVLRQNAHYGLERAYERSRPLPE
jgi:DNA-binding MarR family transcriptional regulator